MKLATLQAGILSLAFAACGGIVEVPSTEAGGAGGSGGAAPDVTPPPPSECRRHSNMSDCCAQGAGYYCMWMDPEGDFQGGCIDPSYEDCGRPLNVCPPGQRCYTRYGPGGRGDCPAFNYGATTVGMCVDE